MSVHTANRLHFSCVFYGFVLVHMPAAPTPSEWATSKHCVNSARWHFTQPTTRLSSACCYLLSFFSAACAFWSVLASSSFGLCRIFFVLIGTLEGNETKWAWNGSKMVDALKSPRWMCLVNDSCTRLSMFHNVFWSLSPNGNIIQNSEFNSLQRLLNERHNSQASCWSFGPAPFSKLSERRIFLEGKLLIFKAWTDRIHALSSWMRINRVLFDRSLIW